jgi:hypothetical protein
MEQERRERENTEEAVGKKETEMAGLAPLRPIC